MQVKMLVDISGTRDGQEWPRKGGVVDLPKAEADHFVSVGMAAAVDAEPKIEAATDAAPVETATKKTAPRRRGGKS